MSTKDLPLFFRLAREVSRYSDHHQHKLGAVIFIKNRPVSFGFNQMKTHPIMAAVHDKKTLHAELAAILNIKNKARLNGASIVVYREQRNGNTGLAKPCESCQKILKRYGINHLIYTTYNGWDEEWVNC